MSEVIELALSSHGRFERLGGYARVRRVGPFIYVAGTTAIETSGRLHAPGDTYEQTRFVLSRIAGLLDEAGSSLDEVVRTRAYLADIATVGEYARAHGEVLSAAKPVTNAVGATLTTPGMMIEIEADAVVRSALRLGESPEPAVTAHYRQPSRRVVIAGGHGQIALRLERLLAARGVDVVGLIRNPGHAADLRRAGAEPKVVDLEQADVAELADALSGADAAVFAAGAGPGSGAARKETVDRAAAVLFADAAERAGVTRYIQVSSMGLDRADANDITQDFSAYLRAKAAAEHDIRTRNLDWTILRPAVLSDEPGSGGVTLASRVLPGHISRDDVAAVIAALLDEPRTIRRTVELVQGEDQIQEAVRQL